MQDILSYVHSAFYNRERGLCSELSKHEHHNIGLYSVRLRDTDANEYLPNVRFFNDYGQAVDYAESLVYEV